MDLKECYKKLGGDFDDVLARFIKEQTVEKFAFKFLDDGSFSLLKESLENNNYEEAFRAVHTLKGICQNLSFVKLYKSSSLLTEALRNKQNNFKELFNKVEIDYFQTENAIKEYKSLKKE